MTSSLGRRLTAAFIVIALGSALLTTVMVNLAFSSRFDAYLDQQRTARERQLAAAFAAAYHPAKGWQLERLDRLAPLVAMAGAEVRLLDRSGDFVWSLANAQMGPEMAEMHREMTSTGPLQPEDRVPLIRGGEQVGELRVRLPAGTVPLADRKFRISVNWLLALGGLLAGTIGAIAGVVVARRTVRPITELTNAALELRAGDRSRRAAVTRRDEIGQLAGAFNQLVDSVEREDAVRRIFAADVAHELRTPLAVLRSQLEAVQDGVVDATPQLIGSLHEETLRLGRLTADLETMTSADSVEFDLQRESIDLAEVVRGAMAGLAHRFQEGHLKLTTRLDPVEIVGDWTRLQQVVTNLLTNALKFVPAGGSVTVTTRFDRGHGEIEVCDDGAGIAADDMDHIFERFYRGRRVRTGGSGIGLAVAATLVAAHGGEVTVTNRPEGGACFRVRLPAVPAPESRHPRSEQRPVPHR